MSSLVDRLVEFYLANPVIDPYRVFKVLRQVAPVWRVPAGRWNIVHYDWVLTRYEDCAFVLRDRRFGANDSSEVMRRSGPTAAEEPALRELVKMMPFLNPPDHTRLRGLVVRAFTSRQVGGLRAGVQELTDRLLDQAAATRRMDVIRDLALPISLFSICQLLGIPEEDRSRFLKGAMKGMVLLEPTPPTRATLDAVNAASEESRAYFEALFEARRRYPQNDLISHLVQAEEAGDRLTTEELFANVRLLFLAGHETTVNLLGNGLFALLRHRDQWQILRDDPTLVPNAIEELLRYDSPVQAIPRVVLEPVVVNGVKMMPGEMVVVAIAAGNRDAAVFPRPDRLDVMRQNGKSLSLGGGIHFCIGAQLVRLQVAVVLETLLRRLPDLQLAKKSPRRRHSYLTRGFIELPVVWD